MNIEKLEVDKEEMEFIIRGLNSTIKKLEVVKDEITPYSNPARAITEKTIKELSKEVEWNELILQEIDDSIEFEAGCNYSNDREDLDEDYTHNLVI